MLGVTAFNSDTDYSSIGATPSARANVLAADVVIGINPPTDSEIENLKAGSDLALRFSTTIQQTASREIARFEGDQLQP